MSRRCAQQQRVFKVNFKCDHMLIKRGVDNLWLVTNTLSKITIIFQGIFRKLVKVTSQTTANLPQIPEGFSNNWLRSPATQQQICHRFLQDLRYDFGLATTQQRTCHRSLRDLPQQWTINSNPQVNSLASKLYNDVYYKTWKLRSGGKKNVFWETIQASRPAH